MTSLLIIIAIVFLLGVIFVTALSLLSQNTEPKEKEKPKFEYTLKSCVMTNAERDFFQALVKAVGYDFYVFPQVHLSAVIDQKLAGQNWNAAFRHINQKSVDFVLCDKLHLAPKLAIELDDHTHERSDRVNRDIEVERILGGSELPLLRFPGAKYFNSDEISLKIKNILEHSPTNT